MPVDMATELTDELGHRDDIREARHTMQRHLLAGHQRGSDDRQGRIFAAADLDFAL